jgi:pimeloyl-ACP methyl ester carboxylesterase
MIEPMCFVGGSMGGSIVAMFATKYPSYVSMICLLSPPPRKSIEFILYENVFFIMIIAGDEYETDMIRNLRGGMYHIILPETSKQFYATIDALSMRNIHLRRLLAKGYLKSRLSMLDKHKQSRRG